MTCDPATDFRTVLAIVMLSGVILGLAAAVIILVGDRRRSALRDARARRLPERLRGTGSHAPVPATARHEP